MMLSAGEMHVLLKHGKASLKNPKLKQFVFLAVNKLWIFRSLHFVLIYILHSILNFLELGLYLKKDTDYINASKIQHFFVVSDKKTHRAII